MNLCICVCLAGQRRRRRWRQQKREYTKVYNCMKQTLLFWNKRKIPGPDVTRLLHGKCVAYKQIEPTNGTMHLQCTRPFVRPSVRRHSANTLLRKMFKIKSTTRQHNIYIYILVEGVRSTKLQPMQNQHQMQCWRRHTGHGSSSNGSSSSTSTSTNNTKIDNLSINWNKIHRVL